MSETFLDMAEVSYRAAQTMHARIEESPYVFNIVGYYLELSTEQALKHLYDDTTIQRPIPWLVAKIPYNSSISKTELLEMQDTIESWRECTSTINTVDIERGLSVVGRLLKEVKAYAGNSS